MKQLAAVLLLTLCITTSSKGDAGEISATHPSLREADLPPLIPASEFYAGGNESRGHRLSPDGTRLAWTERIKGRPTLRVRMLENGHTVTMNHRVRILTFQWALDSRHLLLSAIVRPRINIHPFLSDTNSPQKQPRDLLPFEGVNIRSILLPPAKPDSVLVEANLRTREVYDLYEIDLRTGMHTLRAINHGDTSRWIVSDRGDILGLLQRGTAGAWSVRKGVEAGRSPLLTGEYTDIIDIAQYIPHESSKIYMLTNGGLDKTVLMMLDLDTGEQEVLFERPNVDISGYFMDILAYKPVVIRYHDALPRQHYLDRRLRDDLEKILGSGPMANVIVNGSMDQTRLAIRTETDRSGPSTYLVDRRSGTKELLARHPLRGYENILSPTRPIGFHARDGLSISGYLTLPKGADGKRLPLVVKVHGGPWMRDDWRFDRETQFLANRGYAVLEVNYRGSRGFGKSFMEKGYGELGGKMQDDLIDAVDWAIAEGYADPVKIAILGHSYGGYATLVAMTRTPRKFAAGVSVAGFSDMAALASTLSRGGRLGAWWNRFANALDATGAKEELTDRSPITYAHRVERPLLIVHGTEDRTISKEHSDRFVAKLREKDIPVEYLVFPDDGHLIRREENRVEFARRLETFLATHLGGRAGTGI